MQDDYKGGGRGSNRMEWTQSQLPTKKEKKKK